jgi:hypothetical protein
MVSAFLVAMAWSPEPRAEAKNETLALLCNRLLGEIAPIIPNPQTSVDELQGELDRVDGSLRSPRTRKMLAQMISEIARIEARSLLLRFSCENWRSITDHRLSGRYGDR